jgi:hypothetical protein
MTQVARRPFSRDLYNKHNALGIKVALDMLTQYGYNIIDNGDVEQYSARDCLVAKNGKDVAVEVERKAVWRRKDAWEGYPTVRVPYRKRNSSCDLYVMINEASTCMLICDMNELKKSPTTKYTTQAYNIEEDFFAVPIELFDVLTLENTKWVLKTNKHKLLYEA